MSYFSHRKRILRAMTNGDITPDEDIVDEAADVEKRLSYIRELISLEEAKEAAKDTGGSAEIQEEKEVHCGNAMRQVFKYLLFGICVLKHFMLYIVRGKIMVTNVIIDCKFHYNFSTIYFSFYQFTRGFNITA